MSSTNTIFLKPEDTVNIDGKEFTAAELKERVINEAIFRKHFEELRARQ